MPQGNPNISLNSVSFKRLTELIDDSIDHAIQISLKRFRSIKHKLHKATFHHQIQLILDDEIKAVCRFFIKMYCINRYSLKYKVSQINYAICIEANIAFTKNPKPHEKIKLTRVISYE
jgi:hypothetical protein